jgi:bifunctional non-homologous end joining protein LigD
MALPSYAPMLVQLRALPSEDEAAWSMGMRRDGIRALPYIKGGADRHRLLRRRPCPQRT